MNNNRSEQHDTPYSSEPPKSKDIPVSEAVPAPEEQDASSIPASNPDSEPEPTSGTNSVASMPDAGGGSSAQSESATEAQSPETEAIPIAPETGPASNGTTEAQDPQPGRSEESKGNNTDSIAAPPPDPPTVPKVKIHLVAVGSAPILKRTKFQIGASCAVALLPIGPRVLAP